MNSTHLAAAGIEEPILEHELSSGPSHSTTSNGDIELMSNPTVISREAGDRDPLLLRKKVVPDGDIDGLKQCALSAFLILDVEERNLSLNSTWPKMTISIPS
jgi:hypothetical protein